jgi:hypothetical protein
MVNKKRGSPFWASLYVTFYARTMPKKYNVQKQYDTDFQSGQRTKACLPDGRCPPAMHQFRALQAVGPLPVPQFYGMPFDDIIGAVACDERFNRPP